MHFLCSERFGIILVMPQIPISTSSEDLTVQIAVTYECQCTCRHCSAALFKKPGETYLQPAEIIKLIDEAKKLGAKNILFFGGEPLLHPFIEKFINQAYKNKLETYMDSNAVVLNEEKIIALKNAGLTYLGISLDSPLEEKHDHSRNFKGLYRRAISALKLARKHKLIAYISSVVTKEMLYNGEFLLLQKMTDLLDVHLRIMTPIRCGSWNNNSSVVLSPEDLVSIKSALKKDRIHWEHPSMDSPEKIFSCISLKKSFLYVNAYGEVQPCCFLPLTYGNVRQENFSTIVQKMWATELYEDKTKYSDCIANSDYYRKKYLS